MEKLKVSTDVNLPDPLNKIERGRLFREDCKLLPTVTYPDVYHYLVDTACVYSREAVKAYRSLDAYNYFLSGKVGKIQSFTDKDYHIVYGEVGASQTVSKTYSAWFIAKKEGEIVSGHCTCMAGQV